MDCVIIGSQIHINLASLFTIYTCFSSSKKPFIQILEGLFAPILFISYIIVAFSYSELAWKAPSIILFIAGIYFCLCTTKQIIANVTKQRCTIFEDLHLTAPFFWGMCALPLNFWLTQNKYVEQRQINELIILTFSFVSNLLIYFLYIFNVIRQITECLGIHCFSITKKKVEEKKD